MTKKGSPLKSKRPELYFIRDIVVPMDEIQLDDKLHMIEEPIEVVDREVKRLKQSRIPIVKVRWNSQRGIVSQLTPPYTPQHNGVSERRNQTLIDMVRSMMNLTILPKSFWGYALETAARILNMFPTKKFNRTPYKIWHGRAPNFMVQEVSGSHGLLKMSGSDKGLEIIQEEDTQHFQNTSKEHNEVAPIKYELGDLDEPPNYKAALADPESDKWLEAMNTEMQSMKDN
ncbi:retrotransposon protein, putative, ty1-copia subclass [Tanacetum coccineum]